jgi:hypothetical protein
MEKRENMLAQINSTMLAEYVGEQFDVLDDPEKVFCLTLTHIVEHAKTERQETFSIFFHGPLDSYMLQGMHKLKHNHLGELGIFLVPIGQDQDGFKYEAVFNHMIG